MSTLTVTLVVPSSGDGPIASISDLVGQKTVALTGLFSGGSYILLGSDNGTSFVPIAQFDSGGVEGYEQTISAAFSHVRVRNAGAIPSGSVGMTVTGVVGAGENKFTTLATIAPGASGPQGIIDTHTLFPPSGVEQEIAILCKGSFVGNVVVFGSDDSVEWNPIGEFQADAQPRSLLGGSSSLEFGPLSTKDLTRYLRVDVKAQVTAQTVVTIGGRIPATGGGGGGSSSLSEGTDRLSSADDTEVIIFEEMVNLNNVGTVGNPITPSIQGIGYVSAPGVTGTVRAYLGATNPGDTTGGTVRVTGTFNNEAPEAKWSASGVAFVNPGGRVLLQITLQSDTPSTTVYARGYTVGAA